MVTLANARISDLLHDTRNGRHVAKIIANMKRDSNTAADQELFRVVESLYDLWTIQLELPLPRVRQY